MIIILLCRLHIREIGCADCKRVLLSLKQWRKLAFLAVNIDMVSMYRNRQTPVESFGDRLDRDALYRTNSPRFCSTTVRQWYLNQRAQDRTGRREITSCVTAEVNDALYGICAFNANALYPSVQSAIMF